MSLSQPSEAASHLGLCLQVAPISSLFRQTSTRWTAHDQNTETHVQPAIHTCQPQTQKRPKPQACSDTPSTGVRDLRGHTGTDTQEPRARPTHTHTSPSGTGTSPCQATWAWATTASPPRGQRLSHTKVHTGAIVSLGRAEGTSSQSPSRLAPSEGGSWRHLLPAQGPPVSEHPASSCTPLSHWSPPAHSLVLTDPSQESVELMNRLWAGITQSTFKPMLCDLGLIDSLL